MDQSMWHISKNCRTQCVIADTNAALDLTQKNILFLQMVQFDYLALRVDIPN